MTVRISCFAAQQLLTGGIGRVTINILPDDVLLQIFDHYVAEADKHQKFEEWQMLVHVCQNWRYVVFQSPLRLNLRILCSARTPVREKLALWPPLPLIIQQHSLLTSECDEDNIITALGHNDRVCKIHLQIPSSMVESVFAAMQKTFVALEYLRLAALGVTAPVLPDSFLGGSATHLRHLVLWHIRPPFPVLRKLLLSAANLVDFRLDDVPHSGYISPEAMVTCLSMLTGLQTLRLRFESPRSCPDQETRYPPPPILSVLPALNYFSFKGVNEYLEDLVSRIDAPQLYQLSITFFIGFEFDTPELNQFIGRTPILGVYDEAHLIFNEFETLVRLKSHHEPSDHGMPVFEVIIFQIFIFEL
jgi:F-box-like